MLTIPDYKTRPDMNHIWCYVLLRWVRRADRPIEPEPTRNERAYAKQLRDFSRPEL